MARIPDGMKVLKWQDDIRPLVIPADRNLTLVETQSSVYVLEGRAVVKVTCIYKDEAGNEFSYDGVGEAALDGNRGDSAFRIAETGAKMRATLDALCKKGLEDEDGNGSTRNNTRSSSRSNNDNDNDIDDEVDEDDEDSKHYCEECGNEITSFKNKPGSYWAALRKKMYKKELCSYCVGKHKKNK